MVSRPGETEIEMVRRHIREGEEHVAHQRGIVASLPDSDLAKTARQLLETFKQALESHQEHLARLLHSAPKPGV